VFVRRHDVVVYRIMFSSCCSISTRSRSSDSNVMKMKTENAVHNLYWIPISLNFCGMGVSQKGIYLNKKFRDQWHWKNNLL